MHIVKFIQEEKSIEIGIFNSLENALIFLKKIPGFYIENDGIFNYYYLKNENIEFKYINYKDKLFPYSKYSFKQNMEIEIFIYEIPYFDDNKKGIINSSTLIDAYMINNDEVEEYINLREKKYNKLKKILAKNHNVERVFQNSEDGEMLMVDNKLLLHLDPIFTYEFPEDEEEINGWLKENII